MNPSEIFIYEKEFNMNHYRIRFKGHLDEHRLHWFEGLIVSQKPNGETVISGQMDQAALHGVLNRIRDLGLELISVQRDTLQERNLE